MENTDIVDDELRGVETGLQGDHVTIAFPRMGNVINLMAQSYYEASGVDLRWPQKPYQQTPLSFQLESERRMTCALESLAKCLGYEVMYDPVEKSP